MNAIIIDDEPHCRNVIERILENHCPDIAVVATCADGIEGLKAILQLQPDIVFLDVEMPRMNGLQMLEALGKEDLKFTLFSLPPTTNLPYKHLNFRHSTTY